MANCEIVTEATDMFKILIIGDAGVGKSSLFLRFADNKFDQNYRSTIGLDYRIRRCQSPLGDGVLRMYDTAGQERFRSITTSYYRGVHGFMVVYDVTETTTFQHITQWLREIQRHAESDNVSVVLVGNKCDRGSQKIIEEEHAKEYAKNHGVLFIETSAKDGTNVEEGFQLLTEDLKAKKKSVGVKGTKLEGRELSSLRFLIPNHCSPGEEDMMVNLNSGEGSAEVEKLSLEIGKTRRKRCSSCS